MKKQCESIAIDKYNTISKVELKKLVNHILC